MTESAEKPENVDRAAELRTTLIKRLAIAGVLVALLLGMLAFFDYLSAPPEEPEAPVFTEPVPVAPKKEVSQPVTPSESLPAPPAAAETPVAPEPPPPPVVEETAPAPATLQPVAKPERRLVGRVTQPAPAEPKPSVSSPAPAPVEHEESSAPPIAPPSAPSQPAVQRPARGAEPSAAETRLHRLFSGFLLQAGVFTSVQRAEELHAKLTLSGVPSTLETRVQVGPFRSRQEAEAAQAKLRELGIETILVPPKGTKR